MTVYFKIYGQKRTGTNYISKIFIDNFIDIKVFMNIGGWKHGKIIEIPDEKNLINTVDKNTKKIINISKTIDLFRKNKVKFIVMIKNPYIWINSMCKMKNKSVKNILFVIKQIEIWNTIYKNYKQYIENKKAYLIKYENLIENPKIVLEDLIKEFNLKRKLKKSYILENKKLKSNSDENIGKTSKFIFDKSIYINPSINKFLQKDIIEIINNNIDFTLMDFYNYDIYYNN